MNILEKEIEELIFDALVENPSLLQEKGLEFEENMVYERQPELGSYGRPDVAGFTVDRKRMGVRRIHVTLFEFKKELIDVNTLMQAARYETGIRQYIKHLGLKHVSVIVDIILIGKTIQTSGDFVFLLNHLEHSVKAYTYHLSLTQGLTFQSHFGYYQSTSNFKNPSASISGLKDFLATHNPSLSLFLTGEF